MRPEWKCPECGSTKLEVIWLATVTYDQADDGERRVSSTEDETLVSIKCKECGEEAEEDAADQGWKNKEE